MVINITIVLLTTINQLNNLKLFDHFLYVEKYTTLEMITYG